MVWARRSFRVKGLKGEQRAGVEEGSLHLSGTGFAGDQGGNPTLLISLISGL